MMEAEDTILAAVRTWNLTEVMLVTIKRENINPSKKDMNKAVTMLKLPDVCS
jgi:hypothetical protein